MGYPERIASKGVLGRIPRLQGRRFPSLWGYPFCTHFSVSFARSLSVVSF